MVAIQQQVMRFGQVRSRQIERLLLLAAALFLLINTVALGMVRGSAGVGHWVYYLIWLLTALTGHILLNKLVPGRDPILYPVTLLLTGWGLVIIDRLTASFVERQSLWLVISAAGMLLIAGLPHPLRWLRSYRYFILFVGLALLTTTVALGTNPSGQADAPQLWLGLGSLYFQPSEALKIILVAFLASYLGEQYPILYASQQNHRFDVSPRVVGPVLLMWGLCILILIWQRDLGTAILFFTVFLLLFYIASGQRTLLLGGVLLILAAGLVAYRIFGVVQLRVDVWIDPWPEADGRAFQIVQSLMAFAAGGPLGQGVGQGSPGFIPVVHSDFVFAALAEEWGLLGVVVLVACLGALVTRGLQIAIRLQGRAFFALMAAGLSMLIGIQSLLIMAGVLKLVPLTGVTLPFVSYGGSSLLASYIMVGMLIRLSGTERPA